jgi:hypothetical protein
VARPLGINWDEQPLGQVPDTVLARELGCNITSVLRARQQRGIPRRAPWDAERPAQQPPRAPAPQTPAPDAPPPPSLFLRSERPLVETNVGRVGIVGDIHEPFSVEGYLEFCYNTFVAWGVTRVVMIGDCIDHHAISMHEHDPDGMSPGDEYHAAREAMKGWYHAFPEAVWILGNHDRLPMRQVFKAGLPASMLRANLYDCPDGWQQTESAEIDGVLYVHGGGRHAAGQYGHKNLASHRGMSCVIGHYHRCGGVYSVASRDGNQRFGLQVGCGVDHRSYAMAYCRDDGPCTLGCGIVVDGTVAHFAPMLR